MHIEIKNAGISQSADIAKVAQVIWEEYYTPIIGSKQVDYMLKIFQSKTAIEQQIREGTKYIAAYKNDDLVGYSCYHVEDNALFLSKLYVINSLRGQGIGKKLFLYITQIAKNMNKQKIYLTVNKHNTPAIKVYEHMGFKNERSVVTEIGKGFTMDDYIMVYYI